ncbi:MAG: T9SS type A sorting domain-containing protein [Urechidicola sp.]|nr:T9SS type A sorting domain-containing protein [Urechidicola sp.]
MKRNYYCKLICLLFMTPWMLFAQEEVYKEQQEDAYIYVSRESMQKGSSYRVANADYFTVQVNVDVNGNDIIGDAANEPSIAVDPTNPNRIVIGWRQFDTVASNFRQAGFGYSNDGGLTWTFPGVLDPGVYHTDPVLDFNAEGNFYYNSLLSSYECEVFSITDGGVTWGSPVSARGGDKQWMAIDRSEGIGAGNNYSFWDKNYSSCNSNDFTRSTDSCITFENCEPIDGSPKWGTMTVDADGTLYVAGTSSAGLIVVKSTTAKDTSIPVTFDSYSVVDLDGSLKGAGSLVNPVGLLGQMWVAVDISGDVGHGNVYALATVDRTSNSDPADVMFAKSTDGGQTFNAPIRINADASTDNYQWFGTMSIAPNGRIDVVWLDTRDASTDTNESVLYYSFSTSQGDTWSTNEAISIAFNPNIGYPNQQKMGDYFDMVSDDEGVHLAWANTINGGQDVYYTHINHAIPLGTEDFANNVLNASNYPNPFKEETTITFDAKNEEHIIVEVHDLLGRKVNTLLDEFVNSGKQKINWNARNYDGRKLQAGVYIISIQTKSGTAILKAVIL